MASDEPVILIDGAKERAKLLVQSTKSFQKDESHRKLLERYGGSLHVGIGAVISFNSFSDFPSCSYANFYSTKRKSAKNASDSSLSLISYSPIFASIF